MFDIDNTLKLIYNGPDVSNVYFPNPDVSVPENGRISYNSKR